MKYALAVRELDQVLAGAERVLIATDFDGTLCPIATSPDEVQPLPGTLEILRQISSCSRIALAVISGRSLADVSCRVPVPAIFAGNHGLEIGGRGLDFRHPEAQEQRPALEAVCAELEDVMRMFPGAWVEDKGLSATVHFRRVDRRLHRHVLFNARRTVSRFGRCFALRAGNLALEVRPDVEWGKGSALGFIRHQLGPFDLTIAIGDDRTDETMFLAGPGQINVKVGQSRPTRAEYQLADAAEVSIFLAHILDLCRMRELVRAGAA